MIHCFDFIGKAEISFLLQVPLELKPSALVTPKNEIMLEIEKR